MMSRPGRVLPGPAFVWPDDAERATPRAGAIRAQPLSPCLLRAPLLVLAFIALFAGVSAGLARVGAFVPGFTSALSAWHGVLMTGGFFGGVISLERAIAAGAAGPTLPLFARGLERLDSLPARRRSDLG